MSAGHLSEDRLLDLAEGVEIESAARHVQSCEVCRRRLADLREAMSAAADVAVPEPSPLFWDHLSTRIREAVEIEGETSRSGRWSWLGARPVWAGALALIVFAALFLTRSEQGTSPSTPDRTASSRIPSEDPGAFDDPSLSLVLDLAADLDWDGVSEAGLTTHIGVDNDALTQLTDRERQELQRLLKGELANRGA